MARLLYSGGSTLTFGTESGNRRTVKNGVPFEVSETLAAVLLADPDITIAPAADGAPGDPDVPRETTLVEKSKAELQAIAAELGLEHPRRATNPELVALIEAEQTRLADEAAADAAAGASSDGESDQGGDATPGDDPDADATGEPGTPPSTGAITLGDLPDGTRIAREPS